MTEPTVTNATEHKRYEISADGVRAGLTTYVYTDDQRIFYHTEVDDKFAGRGLASKLIAAALADARAVNASWRSAPSSPPIPTNMTITTTSWTR